MSKFVVLLWNGMFVNTQAAMQKVKKMAQSNKWFHKWNLGNIKVEIGDIHTPYLRTLNMLG